MIDDLQGKRVKGLGIKALSSLYIVLLGKVVFEIFTRKNVASKTRKAPKGFPLMVFTWEKIAFGEVVDDLQGKWQKGLGIKAWSSLYKALLGKVVVKIFTRKGAKELNFGRMICVMNHPFVYFFLDRYTFLCISLPCVFCSYVKKCLGCRCLRCCGWEGLLEPLIPKTIPWFGIESIGSVFSRLSRGRDAKES